MRYKPQIAVNCSTLRERTAGSPPSTSQVRLLLPCWKAEDQRILSFRRFPLSKTAKRNSFINYRHMNWHRIVPWRTVFDEWLTCSWQCATPGQQVRAPEQAQGDISPEKNSCDMQVLSWRHISCHISSKGSWFRAQIAKLIYHLPSSLVFTFNNQHILDFLADHSLITRYINRLL
jgi:hypothetical protein